MPHRIFDWVMFMSLYPQESEFLGGRNCVLIIPAPQCPQTWHLKSSWPILMEQESNSMINIKSVLCTWQLGASHVPCHFTILTARDHSALSTEPSAPRAVTPSVHLSQALPSIPTQRLWIHVHLLTSHLDSLLCLVPSVGIQGETLPVSPWLSSSALSSAVYILNLFQPRG